jgi:hypothetical protein
MYLKIHKTKKGFSKVKKIEMSTQNEGGYENILSLSGSSVFGMLPELYISFANTGTATGSSPGRRKVGENKKINPQTKNRMMNMLIISSYWLLPFTNRRFTLFIDR